MFKQTGLKIIQNEEARRKKYGYHGCGQVRGGLKGIFFVKNMYVYNPD